MLEPAPTPITILPYPVDIAHVPEEHCHHIRWYRLGATLERYRRRPQRAEVFDVLVEWEADLLFLVYGFNTQPTVNAPPVGFIEGAINQE